MPDTADAVSPLYLQTAYQTPFSAILAGLRRQSVSRPSQVISGDKYIAKREKHIVFTQFFRQDLQMSYIFCIFASKMGKMSKSEFLHSLQQLGRNILPANGQLWLYGSRSRHEEHEGSDWDLLVLLDKPKQEFSDFDNYSYPFIEYGASHSEPVSAHIYTKAEWDAMSFTPFYHNVEHDRQVLI